MRFALFCLNLMLFASPLMAQDAIGLAAPKAIVDSGVLKYILPRFSLKTGVRVQADAQGVMLLAGEPPGTPVFRGGGITYFLRVGDDARQQRFLDWMTSDIGKRAIEAFQPDGAAPFSAQVGQTAPVAAPVFSGDAARGAELSALHCGRCHVVSEANRMKGLGSTPSFAVLRSLGDWKERFGQFYALRPHGTFTRITDVSPPFPAHLPPPIFPVTITLDDLESILAFVATTAPADLGPPLVAQ